MEVHLVDKNTGWPARAMLIVYVNPEDPKQLRGRFDNLGELIPPELMAKITIGMFLLNQENLRRLGIKGPKGEQLEHIKRKLEFITQELRALGEFGPEVTVHEGK